VSAQLGHRDASITPLVSAHYLPSASMREADRIDALQPSATPSATIGGSPDQEKTRKSFEESGEPRRNRTFNPQIKRPIE